MEMNPKDGLPDCRNCDCAAANHVIPAENTAMKNKCFSCEGCPGYDPKTKAQRCPDCDAYDLIEVVTDDTFQYGSDAHAVFLTVRMPIVICRNCGFKFYDHRGEEARKAAVKRYVNENRT